MGTSGYDNTLVGTCRMVLDEGTLIFPAFCENDEQGLRSLDALEMPMIMSGDIKSSRRAIPQNLLESALQNAVSTGSGRIAEKNKHA